MNVVVAPTEETGGGDPSLVAAASTSIGHQHGDDTQRSQIQQLSEFEASTTTATTTAGKSIEVAGDGPDDVGQPTTTTASVPMKPADVAAADDGDCAMRAPHEAHEATRVHSADANEQLQQAGQQQQQPQQRKTKRRRRKPSKQAANNQRNKAAAHRRIRTTAPLAEAAATARSALVPYNTNVFLMADHDAHDLPQPAPMGGDSGGGGGGGRRTAATAAEETEAFLRSEFSSVYEAARMERLDAMSKAQLVKEYLQLEANYDRVSRRLRRLHQAADGAGAEAARRAEAERAAWTAQTERRQREIEGEWRWGVRSLVWDYESRMCPIIDEQITKHVNTF